MTDPALLPSLTSRQNAQLEAFAALLTKWNSRINLISPRDLPQLWTRHIGDSLRLAHLIPAGERVVDLGSGGGFPGIMTAVMTGGDVTLVEADQRKAAFLREAARVCELPHVQVVNERIEKAAHGIVAPAPVVTARALAPLPRLLELAAPLLAPGGRCLFIKGRRAPDELAEARKIWAMDANLLQPLLPAATTAERARDDSASDGYIVEISAPHPL
ncbi:16S rRNA (guanine(527)-N(7))-methyltransferase RsmG [Formicincola oecophyllae]|uniref:Ribosomal RNA small subunit methyltransferase G n=1 Tax=Formicincola oecophyllae TaxID=2558361 RepID=A0A4Y6U8I6_9PROT|nr:16S rRNA (guanine(527)-N(7))-methyltransferase RsmG [Formicincola oecophyllae]QDH13504.1 16S rRNA (guanine(527)-N(7))-methyltransferase RsmG [Formicincola oecophyllae]